MSIVANSRRNYINPKIQENCHKNGKKLSHHKKLMKERRQLNVNGLSDTHEKFQYLFAPIVLEKPHRCPGDPTKKFIMNAFAGTLARFEERKRSMKIEIK